MVDSLGFRLKLGIIAPSTNTFVQPEMDAIRPYGVTNHFGRLDIPDDPIKNDDDFNKPLDVSLKGLKCGSPVQIAHVSEKQLRNAIVEVDDSAVEAIVEVGTNLAMARLAGIAEFWIDKPVIAINTAIYWHALRQSGVTDRVPGFGSLLGEY
jgi:maleate cis-trans isomerase